MATNRGKERGSSVGKERRVLSSDSRSKRSSSSRTAEKGSSASEKQVPNYLKPTISSRLETQNHSFQLRSDPNIDRRRSFDSPPSASKFFKAPPPSSSRLHKALVSPGPRQRTVPKRASPNSSSSVSAKSSTASSTPISTRDRGKSPQPLSTLKTTTSRKKQPPANSSTKAPKRNAETRETTTLTLTQNVEETDHRRELINEAPSHDGVAEEVQEKVESVSQETPALVNGEHDNGNDEVEMSDHDPHQIEADNRDKVMPTVSEEVNAEQDVEAETEAAAEEEKAENDEHHEVEEENIKQEDESNEETSHDPQEIPPTEGELVVEVENSQDVKEDLEEKEVSTEGDGRVSEEEVDLKEKVEEEEEAPNKNDESTEAPKQEAAGDKETKESTMAYNDVIEETKTKLMVARKNKVSALVGAFQTVIDHESSSK